MAKLPSSNDMSKRGKTGKDRSPWRHGYSKVANEEEMIAKRKSDRAEWLNHLTNQRIKDNGNDDDE